MVQMKSAQAEAIARSVLNVAQNAQAEDHGLEAVDYEAARTAETALSQAAEESWIAESAIASASDASEVYNNAQTHSGSKTAEEEPRSILAKKEQRKAPSTVAEGTNESSTTRAKTAADGLHLAAGRRSLAKSDRGGGEEASRTRRQLTATPLPPIKRPPSPMDKPSTSRPVPLKRRSQVGVGLSGSQSMPSISRHARVGHTAGGESSLTEGDRQPMSVIRQPRSTTALRDAVLSRPLPTTITMQQLLTERGLALMSGAQGPTHRSGIALSRHIHRFGSSSRPDTSGRWIGTIGLEPTFRSKYFSRSSARGFS